MRHAQIFRRKNCAERKFSSVYCACAWARVYILKECAALLVWAGPRGRLERGKGKGHHFAEVGKMFCPGLAVSGAEEEAGLGLDFVEVASLQWF